ncbi:MAG: HigA family addiction module antitoxin [Acidobacteriaceae bacterium]|nr:HigA family addiction module antitoxin [Acidobacteriaceae bacterium]
MSRMYNPPHPGRILKDAIINIPMSVTEFAGHIAVGRVTLSRVINQKAGITARLSMRISEAFGQSPDLWFRMQSAYDFWAASQEKRQKVKQLKAAA